MQSATVCWELLARFEVFALITGEVFALDAALSHGTVDGVVLPGSAHLGTSQAGHEGESFLEFVEIGKLFRQDGFGALPEFILVQYCLEIRCGVGDDAGETKAVAAVHAAVGEQ